MTALARAFVEAEQAEGRNVVKACELLDVSRSAYYKWHHHRPSARAVFDEDLTVRIGEIHAASMGTYGMPRVHAELRAEGVHVGRKRVSGGSGQAHSRFGLEDAHCVAGIHAVEGSIPRLTRANLVFSAISHREGGQSVSLTTSRLHGARTGQC